MLSRATVHRLRDAHITAARQPIARVWGAELHQGAWRADDVFSAAGQLLTASLERYKQKLRELDDTIRSGRARVQGLLSAQMALQQQLGASLVAAS